MTGFVRVLVFGGRAYDKEASVFDALDALRVKCGRLLIIHGDAHGADAAADTWAKAKCMPCWRFPADWHDLTQPGCYIKTNSAGERYDATAGVRRNTEMLEYANPTIAVKFKGGLGTADMLKKCKKAKVATIIEVD
jgi:hypothetical protein